MAMIQCPHCAHWVGLIVIRDRSATHTRKGLGASPVVPDWSRGTGLVPTPVEKEAPLGAHLPSSRQEDEGNGWPR